MTDRELLEMAAKAAGIEIFAWTRDGNGVEVAMPVDADGYGRWQPLHENQMTDSDGDALRLAVKLRLSAYHAPKGWLLLMNPDGSTSSRVDFGDESERLVATRRAITRAAAEIGKGMP